MAVISYEEVNQPEANIDQDGNRTCKRTFQVISDDKLDGPNTIATAVPISLWQSYSYGHDTDVYALCKAQDAKVISRVNGDQWLWSYTLTYDSKPLAWGVSGADTLAPPGGSTPTDPQPPSQQQPDLRPWVIRGTGVTSTKALTLDFSSTPKPALNSAKMPFKDGLQTEVSAPSFSITLYRALANWNQSKATLYRNTVNETAKFGYAAGRLRCTKYDWSPFWEFNQYWYQLDLEFQVALDDDWDARILDAGTHTYNSSTNDWKEIRNKLDGKPVTSPVMLNGSGGVLNAATSAPVYLKFRTYVWRDWTNIV